MANTLNINSTYKLNSGFEIPLLGYGTLRIPPEHTSFVVQQALKAGYRHIDSATYFKYEAAKWGNQAACADAIKNSGVPRDQIFFTTKVPDLATSYDLAKKAIDKSLSEVGDLGYIDLMIIWAPYGGREGRIEVWKALTEAVEAGRIRSIGVSNFGVKHLEELEKHIAETDATYGKGKGGVLSVNQIECHPWLQRRDIIDWCQKRGVLVQAWAPLARATRWGDRLLQDIVKSTGKTEAQILLRWSLQKGLNPLPKSLTPERIDANTDIFDFELSDEQMASLETDEYDYHGWDPTITHD